jgi:hypothetical protein
MWDWVLSAPKSLSLASYASLFPNIFSLGKDPNSLSAVPYQILVFTTRLTLCLSH